ncbi:MAG TPA: SDR family oxidoreductase [Ilumatobacteraceae bacterium]|nr:SDR family oxidoreductase [Ilumatobacteraceae bacterium]
MIKGGRFDGKVVVITGGAGAFGTELGKQFHIEGAHVVLADLDGDAASLVASTYGDKIASRQLDVTDAKSVAAAMDFVEQLFGGIDVLVNNAGLTHRPAPLDEMSDDAYDLVFGVNVKGTYLCCKHAIPALRRSGRGAIVNLSSVAAIAHRAGNTVYSASKAAVVAFTRNLALELAPTIRVNAILPVAADTPFFVNAFGERLPAEAAEAMRAGIPMGRLCEPSDVAKAVAFLASDEAAFITGECLVADGGRSLT